jgi:Dolichyl-phosphate-mannose-protein mannosyltransferase
MAVAVAVLVAISSDLVRAGYSPDEEFTLFAVRGIQASGLPLLPSGLLYDRGLAYSYAAWAGTLVGGSPLTAGRILSLVCSALAVAVVFRHVARLGSTLAAAAAVGLVATSLPFWVSATTARFYAPFLLGYLLCLALMGRSAPDARGLVGLAVAVGLTRWTHELAFTLAAVPVVACVVAPPSERRRWALTLVAVVAGLVGGQLAIFGVHALAPPTNGAVMVRRFFLWQIVNLLERPPFDLPRLLPGAAVAGALTAVALAWVRLRHDLWSGATILIGGLASSLGQLGVGPLAALAGLPIVSGSARRAAVGTSLVVLAASVAFWALALSVAGLPPREAVARLGETGFLYPLDMLSYLVGESPWLVCVTLTGLLARAAGRGGEWTWPERALHLLWLGWVVWFGVVESGITARYLLLPVTFMLTAVAIDASALARTASGAWRGAALLVAAVLAAAVVAESWLGPVGDARRWVETRPTFGPATLADEIQPDDLVVSTDELAGMMVAGRLDAWLVLDEFFRERFVVERGGIATGTYTGAPAASSLGPLLERGIRERRRLIVVDVLKDMPGFGPTAGLVPRQLAREELRGEVVAETDGIRLVQVRPGRENSLVRR